MKTRTYYILYRIPRTLGDVANRLPDVLYHGRTRTLSVPAKLFFDTLNEAERQKLGNPYLALRKAIALCIGENQSTPQLIVHQAISKAAAQSQAVEPVAQYGKRHSDLVVLSKLSHELKALPRLIASFLTPTVKRVSKLPPNPEKVSGKSLDKNYR